MADAVSVDSGSGPDVLPEHQRTEEDGTSSHDLPLPAHLQEAIARDWDPAPPMPHPAHRGVAAHAARRRAALSRELPGTLIVVPAGGLKVRANDTEYPFRAASAFTWLTGETVSEAVLMMFPKDDGHDSVLYVREFAQPGEVEYFTNRMYGAVWVGNVPSLSDTTAALDITTRPLNALRDDLPKYRDDPTALLRGFDSGVEELLPTAGDIELGQLLDELRTRKDDWELGRLRFACEATARGFADVVRELPLVVGRPGVRGERWLEGTFWRRARIELNGLR